MLNKYVQFFEDNRDSLIRCVIKIKKYRNIQLNNESFDENNEQDAHILYELIDNIYNNIQMKELTYNKNMNNNCTNYKEDNESVCSNDSVEDIESSIHKSARMYNEMKKQYDINVVKNIIKSFTKKYGPNWRNILQTMSEEEKKQNCYDYSFQYEYYKKVMDYIDSNANANANINTFII